MPEELTIVVSVTEPKLLIKILHVTFTGGPVKWNDNDMIRKEQKKKKAIKGIVKNEVGAGCLNRKVNVCCLMPTCNNTNKQRAFVFDIYSKELQAWMVTCYMLC